MDTPTAKPKVRKVISGFIPGKGSFAVRPGRRSAHYWSAKNTEGQFIAHGVGSSHRDASLKAMDALCGCGAK